MTKPIFSASDNVRFGVLREIGEYNWLVSYWYVSKFKGKTFREKVEGMKWKPETDNHFFLDSGAFSAWTKGVKITVEEYIEFCKQVGDMFTNIVCLDVIQDPVASEYNHLKMLDAGIEKVIPVYHAGEPYSVIENMFSKGYKYIGIAGGAHNLPITDKLHLVNDLYSRYGKELSEVKTHGFGYLDARALYYMDLTTADSASWLISAVYGVIRTPWGSFATSERSKEKGKHLLNIQINTRDKVIEWLEKDVGFKIEDLDDFNNRCKVNWYYFKHINTTKESGNPIGYVESAFEDDGTGWGYAKTNFEDTDLGNYVPNEDGVPPNRKPKKRVKVEKSEQLTIFGDDE